MTAKVGLVLTGGGARGAYQAGVLRGIAELLRVPMPFRILTGSSAGAINAMAVAAAAEDFDGGTTRLWHTWAGLTPDRIFRTDASTIARIGTRWMRDLALGGLLGGSSSNHLLDTAPLRELLEDSIDCVKVASNVRHGFVQGVGITATDYASARAVTFYDATRPIKPWLRMGRGGCPSSIGIDHIMASAAIPVFFPPQRLGGTFYGDGCIRLAAPLSSAIHLGAERILAIGLQHERSQSCDAQAATLEQATVADIAGALLNAFFIEGLSGDLERLERINRTMQLLHAAPPAASADRLRVIPVLALRPSRDLRSFASEELERLPATLRYMLRGLGASGPKGWDLLSYLSFDGAYTRRLLDLGYEDALGKGDAIRAFFDGASDDVAASRLDVA